MTEHLTDEELRGYAQRSLDAARLLTVDDHIASCSLCQGRASLHSEAEAAIPYIRAAVAPNHLRYEDLAAYADGRPLDASVREHLDHCARCQADAADLRTFAAEAKRVQSPVGSKLRPWTYGVAAAAVAAGLAAFMIRIPGPKTVPPSPVAHAAMPALPADIAEAVTASIRQGRIDVPQPVVALGGRTGQLLGQASQSPNFDVTGPKGTATVSDRPEFRWSPLPGARSYRVAIYDASFNEVAHSPLLTSASWQPANPLPRGKAYVWQVTAKAPGGEVTAPRPPAPEAKFLILPEAEASRLEALRAKFPAEHLALGVALGRAGDIDGAAAELRQTTGPNAAAAAKLLASLPRTTSPKS